MLFYLNPVPTTLVDVKCLIKDLEHQLFRGVFIELDFIWSELLIRKLILILALYHLKLFEQKPDLSEKWDENQQNTKGLKSCRSNNIGGNLKRAAGHDNLQCVIPKSGQ